MSFPNVYAHRKVADTAKRGCDICYRATSSVLLSEGSDAKVKPARSPPHQTPERSLLTSPPRTSSSSVPLI